MQKLILKEIAGALNKVQWRLYRVPDHTGWDNSFCNQLTGFARSKFQQLIFITVTTPTETSTNPNLTNLFPIHAPPIVCTRHPLPCTQRFVCIQPWKLKPGMSPFSPALTTRSNTMFDDSTRARARAAQQREILNKCVSAGRNLTRIG